MGKIKGRIVTGYAQMWPRTVFDLRENGKLLQEIRDLLGPPGVYVLYREDVPHYIGKTSGSLFERIYDHANIAKDKLFNFWNFFSAYEIPRSRDRDEVEAILISAMPSANSAAPKIPPIPIPRRVGDVLKKRRQIDVAHPKLATE